MNDELARRPGTVIDAEFEDEPGDALRFPEPPRGQAYLVYGGSVYLVEIGGLSLSEDRERSTAAAHEPITRFILYMNGRAKKVATL